MTDRKKTLGDAFTEMVEECAYGHMEFRRCSRDWCDRPAKPHWDNGLYCGDDLCDEHFQEMVNECRRRSW